jgi:hypothetical protein
MHEKGISVLTAEEKDTAQNLGPAGRRKAALHSIPLYAAPVGQAEDAGRQKERDEAFEAVRQRLCKLQRYSFWLVDGGVKRMPERYGNWLDFEDVHKLFDPVVVDAAVAAMAAQQAVQSQPGDAK